MTRIKFLLPFLLLGLFVAVGAFTYASKTTTKTTKKAGQQFNNRASAVDLPYYYFIYTGPANPLFFDDYIDPDNYILVEEDPSMVICDYGSSELCAILCEGDWNGWEIKPVFSDDWWKTKPALYNYYLYGGLTGGYLYIRA